MLPVKSIVVVTIYIIDIAESTSGYTKCIIAEETYISGVVPGMNDDVKRIDVDIISMSGDVNYIGDAAFCGRLH
ncbi:hypothetical protein [uncultured Chitinophaga sp.]|uniref:hypothetical protein n=1 Tax=uncultured Chitinophaga sp. TaxID=339340 RepID=UPI0025EB98EF|nr:hypothetical protein [uncultured Chitinophaga sp.]